MSEKFPEVDESPDAEFGEKLWHGAKVIFHQAVHHNKLAHKIVPSLESTEYMNECTRDHDVKICAIGTTVKTISTLAVEEMSAGLAFASSVIPYGVIIRPVATYTLIKSDEIGKSFGNATVELAEYLTNFNDDISVKNVKRKINFSEFGNIPHPIALYPQSNYKIIKSNEIGKPLGDIMIGVTDYLIEHVPSKYIDDSKPIMLKNRDISIVFHQNEVKLVKQLIRSNQVINDIIKSTNSTKNKLEHDMIKYYQNTKNIISGFDRTTKQIELAFNCSTIKRLETLDIVHQNLSKINTDTLTKKINRYECANLQEQANVHNSNPFRSSNAEVRHDSDGWKIAFTVFSFSFGGAAGTSGSICVIL